MVGLCRLVARGRPAADALFLWRWPACGTAGQLAFCGLVALSTSAVAYGASVAAGTYMVTGEIVGWGVLAFFLVLSLAMALVQALEMVETIWRGRWTREALPAAEMIARQPADRRWPKVSVHLAICNEPPAMVIQTLDSLARARLSELRSASSSTTTPRTRGVAAGGGLLRAARRALPLLPLRRHEGLQGRRAELRAERRPRPTPRSIARHRQRLHGAARLAEGRWCRHFDDPRSPSCRPAGPPRLDRQSAFKAMLQLGVCAASSTSA